MATAGPSLADLPLEVLETVMVLLDWRALRAMSTVSVKLRSISHSVAKTKCCSFIPSDIFIEIWEELGCEDDINFLKVWESWSESQLKAGDLQSSAVSDLSLSQLKSNFSGGWTPHSHGHQLICSTFT